MAPTETEGGGIMLGWCEYLPSALWSSSMILPLGCSPNTQLEEVLGSIPSEALFFFLLLFDFFLSTNSIRKTTSKGIKRKTRVVSMTNGNKVPAHYDITSEWILHRFNGLVVMISVSH